MKENRNPSVTITLQMIRLAKENLIKRRETHLDQLIDKLKEKRIQRVIEPLITSKNLKHSPNDNDVEYVMDLRLIVRITHKLYQYEGKDIHVWGM